jgi:hypothetical protein
MQLILIHRQPSTFRVTKLLLNPSDLVASATRVQVPDLVSAERQLVQHTSRIIDLVSAVAPVHRNNTHLQPNTPPPPSRPLIDLMDLLLAVFLILPPPLALPYPTTMMPLVPLLHLQAVFLLWELQCPAILSPVLQSMEIATVVSCLDQAIIGRARRILRSVNERPRRVMD